jgi:hypothetical protein
MNAFIQQFKVEEYDQFEKVVMPLHCKRFQIKALIKTV